MMAEVAIVRAWLSPLAGDRDVSGLVVPWDNNFRDLQGSHTWTQAVVREPGQASVYPTSL